MKLQLRTASGDHVRDGEMPPFNRAADVICWGSRVFVFTHLEHDGVERQAVVGEKLPEAGTLIYTEAFVYSLPPVSLEAKPSSGFALGQG